MNKERILKLASMLRHDALPKIKGKCVHFNMDAFFEIDQNVVRDKAGLFQKYEVNWCGTEACLAGLTVLNWKPSVLHINTQTGDFITDDVETQAARILGIDYDVAQQLFVPKWLYHAEEYGFPETTNTDKLRAAAVLERLAKTGKVDWEMKEMG